MIDTLPLLPDDRDSKFDSRYRVVLVAAQRAKQIMRGSTQPQTSKFAKETSMALEEVLGDKVPYLMGEDARQALREAKRSLGGEFEPALLPEANEDTKEIKQQLSVYVDDSPKEPAVEAEPEAQA